MEPDSKTQVARLTPWQLVCLNALSMPVALAGLVLVTFIPTYYAVDLGLGLGVVGIVFVFGRLLDVVTDPLIGYCSDHTKSRFGPRFPWIMLGLPGFCVAAWLLFNPPENVSLVYLVFASGLYFLFYTLLDIPYSSISLEISPYVNERSVVASYKALFQVIGALTAAAIPLFFLGNTPSSLSFSSLLIFVFSVVGLTLLVVFVPKRSRSIGAERPTIIRALASSWQNRHFRFLIVAFFVVQTANALSAGLTVLFVTHIVGAPGLIGAFVGLVILSSALFLPLWVWLSKRKTKTITWIWSLTMGGLALALTPFLAEGDVIAFGVVCVLVGAAIGCDAIMPTSMLADIVCETDKEGVNRQTGLCLAVKNSVSKLTFIAPMGLAFPLLDVLGFEAKGVNSSADLFVLTFFYALLPIGLRIATIVILRRMPTFDIDIDTETDVQGNATAAKAESQ